MSILTLSWRGQLSSKSFLSYAPVNANACNVLFICSSLLKIKKRSNISKPGNKECSNINKTWITVMSAKEGHYMSALHEGTYINQNKIFDNFGVIRWMNSINYKNILMQLWLFVCWKHFEDEDSFFLQNCIYLFCSFNSSLYLYYLTVCNNVYNYITLQERSWFVWNSNCDYFSNLLSW